MKLPTQSVNSSALAKQYPYLKDIELQSYEEAVPTILLGLPHAYLFRSQGEISGRFNDPIVRNTLLGLIIYGNSKEYRHENVRANINFVGGINRLTGSIRGGKRRQKTKSNKSSVKLEKPDTERTLVKKGVVIKTFPAKGGGVRSAIVKTITGEYSRPVAKLAVLDVRTQEEDSENGNKVVKVQTEPHIPKRKYNDVIQAKKILSTIDIIEVNTNNEYGKKKCTSIDKIKELATKLKKPRLIKRGPRISPYNPELYSRSDRIE